MSPRLPTSSTGTTTLWLVAMLCAVITIALPTAPTAAQQQPEDNLSTGEFADSADTGASGETTNAGQSTTRQNTKPGINLLWLLFKGGFLMIPIVIMSFVVIAFVIERFLGLRRSKVIPEDLVTALGQVGGQGGFDPRQAYKLCQQYPSSAATVIRAMLLKVGRPHSEVEHAVSEASDREADRMYANVRWLTMAAAVAPLLGLFGTVWGMIQAFHELSYLAPHQSAREQLASGIYVAMVTTLCGLAVAIPAAICAHFLEGRITMLFHQIDELLFNLMPQVERYEGRLRFGRGVADGESTLPPETPQRSADGQQQPVAS